MIYNVHILKKGGFMDNGEMSFTKSAPITQIGYHAKIGGDLEIQRPKNLPDFTGLS